MRVMPVSMSSGSTAPTAEISGRQIFAGPAAGGSADEQAEVTRNSRIFHQLTNLPLTALDPVLISLFDTRSLTIFHRRGHFYLFFRLVLGDNEQGRSTIRGRAYRGRIARLADQAGHQDRALCRRPF